MNEQKITAQDTGGLFFGQADGKTVCGPYMNKGMAIRQAKRIVVIEVSEYRSAT